MLTEFLEGAAAWGLDTVEGMARAPGLKWGCVLWREIQPRPSLPPPVGQCLAKGRHLWADEDAVPEWDYPMAPVRAA